MGEQRIADAEWRVMEIVWSQGPIAAAEVVAALQEQTDWKPTTIKTLLHRLVRKRCLSFRKDGNRYVYRAKIAREQCLREVSESFLDRFFEGETLPLLLHFARSGKLQPGDLDEIKRRLDAEEASHE